MLGGQAISAAPAAARGSAANSAASRERCMGFNLTIAVKIEQEMSTGRATLDSGRACRT